MDSLEIASAVGVMAAATPGYESPSLPSLPRPRAARFRTLPGQVRAAGHLDHPDALLLQRRTLGGGPLWGAGIDGRGLHRLASSVEAQYVPQHRRGNRALYGLDPYPLIVRTSRVPG